MDKTHIYSLVKHLIDQIGEKKFYFIVNAFNDDKVAFEILWEKNETLPWSFSLYKADNWTACSTLDILDALEEIECDLMDFQNQVVDKILTQAAYMDMRLKSTRELLGDTLVDAHIKSYEEFGKELVATIAKVLGNKKKKDLTLVKG